MCFFSILWSKIGFLKTCHQFYFGFLCLKIMKDIFILSFLLTKFIKAYQWLEIHESLTTSISTINHKVTPFVQQCYCSFFIKEIKYSKKRQDNIKGDTLWLMNNSYLVTILALFFYLAGVEIVLKVGKS